MLTNDDSEFRQKIEAGLREIGASTGLPTERALPLFEDATELELAHVSQSGREHFMTPEAAECWGRMRDAAATEDVVLVMISGFRSFDQQLELIRQKLAAGQAISEILEVLAPPGCSEHHTGRAADIGTPGCEPLSERFEGTAAFGWLNSHAHEYGFHLSYPRSNPMGFRYEPWHWCLRTD